MHPTRAFPSPPILSVPPFLRVQSRSASSQPLLRANAVWRMNHDARGLIRASADGGPHRTATAPLPALSSRPETRTTPPVPARRTGGEVHNLIKCLTFPIREQAKWPGSVPPAIWNYRTVPGDPPTRGGSTQRTRLCRGPPRQKQSACRERWKIASSDCH